MKRCFKCGRSKTIDDFYEHPMMADGHLGKCKECARADTRANRQLRSDYYIEYDRRRYVPDREQRIARARFRDVKPASPEQKKRAAVAVNNAVRDGRLTKGKCAECGASENVEAHHLDYSKPLEVIWLCITHHDDQHLKAS